MVGAVTVTVSTVVTVSVGIVYVTTFVNVCVATVSPPVCVHATAPPSAKAHHAQDADDVPPSHSSFFVVTARVFGAAARGDRHQNACEGGDADQEQALLPAGRQVGERDGAGEHGDRRLQRPSWPAPQRPSKPFVPHIRVPFLFGLAAVFRVARRGRGFSHDFPGPLCADGGPGPSSGGGGGLSVPPSPPRSTAACEAGNTLSIRRS